jgi:hypothetical protein
MYRQFITTVCLVFFFKKSDNQGVEWKALLIMSLITAIAAATAVSHIEICFTVEITQALLWSA